MQNELHVHIRTTDECDQNKVSDDQPYVSDCNAEQNYSTIDENFPHDTYSSPYYSIESVPGESTINEHHSKVHKPDPVDGQTNPPKVSGNSIIVQHSDCETYDHTNVEEKVLPFNEYNYLRKVDTYDIDASETYDKTLVPSVRLGTTPQDERGNETYDVTKF